MCSYGALWEGLCHWYPGVKCVGGRAYACLSLTKCCQLCPHHLRLQSCLTSLKYILFLETSASSQSLALCRRQPWEVELLASETVQRKVKAVFSLPCSLGWTWDCFQEWGSYIQLAVPSMFMVCIEWWTFEIGTFLAGWSVVQRKSENSLADLVSTPQET